MPAGYNWRISDAKSLDAFTDRDLPFHRDGHSGGRWRHVGGGRLTSERLERSVVILLGSSEAQSPIRPRQQQDEAWAKILIAPCVDARPTIEVYDVDAQERRRCVRRTIAPQRRHAPRARRSGYRAYLRPAMLERTLIISLHVSCPKWPPRYFNPEAH